MGCSIVTVVRRLGTPSSASTLSSHSPSTVRSLRLKRVGVALRVAPRPLIDSTGMAAIYAACENRTRTDVVQGSPAGLISVADARFVRPAGKDGQRCCASALRVGVSAFAKPWYTHRFRNTAGT